MKEKSLYVDVDGVTYNWDAQAHKLLTNLTGKQLTYPSPSWDSLEQEAGPEAWKALWSKYIYELFADGCSIKGAFNALCQLAPHYRITLVTCRPTEARYATLEWLLRYTIPFDSLVLVGRHKKKSAVLRDPPNFFIDDKPANILDAQEGWGLRDNQVFLFPATYNASFKHPSRVSGWGEILEKLLP